MQSPAEIAGLFSARRIIVTGGNGAGKSVFATELAAILDIRLHRNDALVLLQNWRSRSDEGIAGARDEIAKRDAWVIEGGPSLLGHGRMRDRAMYVIWLDLPPLLRCWRILSRTWRYHGETRPGLPEGNPEGFNRRHWRFLRKAWKNHSKVQSTIEAAELPCPVLRLRSRVEASALLSALKQTQI